MNILIVTPIFPPEWRGPATYSFELAKRVSSKVITFTKNPVKIDGVPIFSVSTSGGTLLRQIRLFKKILEEAIGCDVIYAQGADVVGFAAVIVGKLLRKLVVIKFVGDLSVEMVRDFNREVWYLMPVTKITLNLADKIIFPAKHLQELICKKYNLNVEKTKVIYNAI